MGIGFETRNGQKRKASGNSLGKLKIYVLPAHMHGCRLIPQSDAHELFSSWYSDAAELRQVHHICTNILRGSAGPNP